MGGWKIFLLSVIVCIAGVASGCDREKQKAGPVYADRAATDRKQTYPVSLVPIYNPTKAQEIFGPIVDGLNRMVPVTHFSFETSRDFADFENKIRNRSLALIWPNHLQALMAIDSGYHVILKGKVVEPLHGLLIVRKDSGISIPSDLKGKAVSYPSPTALLASILTQHYLHSQGINVNKDITNKYVGSMDSAIMNVALGQTAAAGGYSLAWETFQKDHPDEASQLKVIWETESLDYTVIQLRNDVPKEIEEEIVNYIVRLKETEQGRQLVRSIGVTEYVAATDMDTAKIRQIISEFEKNIRPIKGN